MSLLFMKIRKNRWALPDNASWVSEGDIHADPLNDLKTTKGSLSVWVVEPDESNLRRLAVALAAACDGIANIDYILFEDSIVDNLCLNLVATDGNTPDSVANKIWHRDVVELSAAKLAELACSVFHNSRIERMFQKEVRGLLREAVREDRIALESLAQRIRDKLT